MQANLASNVSFLIDYQTASFFTIFRERMRSVFLFNILIIGVNRDRNPSPTALFVSLFLNDPYPWIIFNIFPYFIIILLIPDHVVVIGTLEYRQANFFGC